MSEVQMLHAGGRWIRTFGPSRKGAAVSASHHAEFVDDHPFRISDWGSIPYAPKESREQQRQRFSPDPSP